VDVTEVGVENVKLKNLVYGRTSWRGF